VLSAGDPNLSLIPIEKLKALSNITYSHMVCVLLREFLVKIETDTVIAYADYQAVAGHKSIDSDIPIPQFGFQPMGHGILDKRLNDKFRSHHVQT
jgi:hypothetical protein